jgi:RNA-directed DNA polymerase
MLWQWALRRHPTKSRHWIGRKYFLNRKGQWQFHGWQKIANMDCQFNLVQIDRTPIKRHVKIRNASSPYDPQFAAYLSKRKLEKESRNTWLNPVLAAL